MHAYLIIAHKNLNQLIKLIKILDYNKNDIYLHIDKKAEIKMKEYDYKSICTYSNIFVYSELDINWGSVNQIKCELFLLEKAVDNNQYDYYHLISGLDFPLKSQKMVHDFFNNNNGKEFIHFASENGKAYDKLEDRAKYYRLTNYYNILPYNSLKIMRKLDLFQIKIQHLIGINRLKKNGIPKLYRGSNWFSITHNLALDLIKNKSFFMKIYNSTYCCDEVFLQTYVANSKWYDNVYHKKMDDNYLSIMRYIDWNRGGPYTWGKNDYKELVNSNYLFARKFDEEHDQNIINMIFKKIMEEKDEK